MSRRDDVIEALADGPEPPPVYFHDIPDAWIEGAISIAQTRGSLGRARMLAEVLEERREARE